MILAPENTIGFSAAIPERTHKAAKAAIPRIKHRTIDDDIGIASE
jgi:hypothetical protein